MYWRRSLAARIVSLRGMAGAACLIVMALACYSGPVQGGEPVPFLDLIMMSGATEAEMPYAYGSKILEVGRGPSVVLMEIPMIVGSGAQKETVDEQVSLHPAAARISEVLNLPWVEDVLMCEESAVVCVCADRLVFYVGFDGQAHVATLHTPIYSRIHMPGVCTRDLVTYSDAKCVASSEELIDEGRTLHQWMEVLVTVSVERKARLTLELP